LFKRILLLRIYSGTLSLLSSAGGYFLYFYSRDSLSANLCTRPSNAAPCTFVRHNRVPRVTKGVKARTGLLDFYTCTACHVCARTGRHAFKSMCIHSCIHVAAICVVPGRVRDLLCINLRCVYHPRAAGQ